VSGETGFGDIDETPWADVHPRHIHVTSASHPRRVLYRSFSSTDIYEAVRSDNYR